MPTFKLNWDLIIKAVGIAFALGMGYQQFNYVRQDIARLEQKQEKYNNLQERVLRNELKIESNEIRLQTLDKVLLELKGYKK